MCPSDGHCVTALADAAVALKAEAFLMETENLHVVSLGDLGAYGKIRGRHAWFIFNVFVVFSELYLFLRGDCCRLDACEASAKVLSASRGT